jgi:murein DD-endopeptidase MepM/ murein hydrolase activator NlpD
MTGAAMEHRYNSWVLRCGAITLATLMVAACQTPYSGDGQPGQPGLAVPKPNFPSRQETLPPPPPPPAVYNPPAPDYGAPPQGAIESQPLPPPAPRYEPPAPPPPPPARPVESRPLAAGRVVSADGPPQTHTVKPGDTLYSISRAFQMTVDELAVRNDLKKPYVIHPGQVLKGPAGKGGKAYIVESGDTLSAIGRRFSVSAADLAAANDMDVTTGIRPGQRLLLPQGYRDQGATRVASRPSPPPPASPSTSYPRPTPTPTPAPRPTTPSTPVIVPSSPPATSSDIQTAGRGKFIWPISGRVVSGFGVRGPNQQSNGLNIASTLGTSVRAAAAGEVIYAGSEVQDYGNLVLVRHDAGFVTVYAHLSRISVKMQDRVTQNQEVGQVGQSGGLSAPQLYFEMRHQQSTRDMARPFDPMLVLPPR